jgi:hypothetical protein
MKYRSPMSSRRISSFGSSSSSTAKAANAREDPHRDETLAIGEPREVEDLANA